MICGRGGTLYTCIGMHRWGVTKRAQSIVQATTRQRYLGRQMLRCQLYIPFWLQATESGRNPSTVLEDLRSSVGGSALSAQHQPTIVMDPAHLGANVVTMTCCNRCPLVQSYRALRRTSESERSLKPTRIYIFGNNRKRSRERLRRYITG